MNSHREVELVVIVRREELKIFTKRRVHPNRRITTINVGAGQASASTFRREVTPYVTCFRILRSRMKDVFRPMDENRVVIPIIKCKRAQVLSFLSIHMTFMNPTLRRILRNASIIVRSLAKCIKDSYEGVKDSLGRGERIRILGLTTR